jgi:putative transposase
MSVRRSAKTKQLALAFPNTWGGKRKGAGRKRGARGATAHRARAEHRAANPVHVTMRSAIRPLRHAFVFPTLRLAIAAANRRDLANFRIARFSVQFDHLHLIVEATDKTALSSGMRGLAVRIARRVNSLLSRGGSFWGDRWHGRELTSPRAVRHVLRYVLNNFRKHHPKSTAMVDHFSSAPFFTSFEEYKGHAPLDAKSSALGPPTRARDQPSTAAPRTWLLRVGWRKLGPLSIHDRPGLSGSQQSDGVGPQC